MSTIFQKSGRSKFNFVESKSHFKSVDEVEPCLLVFNVIDFSAVRSFYTDDLKTDDRKILMCMLSQGHTSWSMKIVLFKGHFPFGQSG